jgi:hypothetical protein
MEQPKPDNIQSQPPERRPEEIQAHAPPPHVEATLTDYDLKKRSFWGERLGAWFLASWQEEGTWVLILVLIAFLVVSLVFLVK